MKSIRFGSLTQNINYVVSGQSISKDSFWETASGFSSHFSISTGKVFEVSQVRWCENNETFVRKQKQKSFPKLLRSWLAEWTVPMSFTTFVYRTFRERKTWEHSWMELVTRLVSATISNQQHAHSVGPICYYLVLSMEPWPFIVHTELPISGIAISDLSSGICCQLNSFVADLSQICHKFIRKFVIKLT